ncbi:neuropeptide CCHamide-1 receptor-like [Bacillus rossius redtenbacheri]|uniref:neuropeptide CCHamide-1 receptor-like n=1 Tax=Bacillus rossius redtenbacheri TaxID=93214 RepID=UPI002FDEA0A7
MEAGECGGNSSCLAGAGSTQLPYTEYSLRPETYVIPVVFALIFVVGVVGNGTLVLIFLRHGNMRNVPNTYIFSLALGDLLVIVTCVPFTSTVYTVESWPFGEFVCKLSESAKDVSIGVSVFTLTALSGDRYFAIAAPMRRHRGGGGGGHPATRFTVAVAALVWLLALLCAAPAAVNSYIKPFNVTENFTLEVCYPFPDSLGRYYPAGVVTAKFFVYYLVPLGIIALFYSLMARHLILSTRNMPGEMQGQARQVRARRKVAKTVLVFVIVFAVCFFPQHVFMLWFYYNPDSDRQYDDFWHVFRMVGFCLGFINSCVNPIALYCVSGAFRKHFNRYLLCCAWLRTPRSRGSPAGQGHRASCSRTSSRRRPGSLTSSVRRERLCAVNYKSNWDSTALTLLHANNGRPRHDEPSATSFVNGGTLSDIINAKS